MVNLISDNIRCNYFEHAPRRKNASSTLRTHWWNWFGQKVTYHSRDKDKVKKAWEDAMKDRLRHMIYRDYHKEENEKPEWIDLDLFRKLKKRPVEEPGFQEKLEKYSANRKPGSEEKGKALGTHLWVVKTPYKLWMKWVGLNQRKLSLKVKVSRTSTIMRFTMTNLEDLMKKEEYMGRDQQ